MTRQTIDHLAASIRAECLSGWTWNVPAKFKDAAAPAKEHWRNRAVKILGEELGGVT